MRMTKAKLAATGNGLHVNVDRLKDDTDLSSLVSGNMQTQEKKKQERQEERMASGKKKCVSDMLSLILILVLPG